MNAGWSQKTSFSQVDRHELVKELLKKGFIAKYEDLKDVLDRSESSAERILSRQLNLEFSRKINGKNGSIWQRWGN